MACDRSISDSPALRLAACGARLALVLIEDDFRTRERFVDVIAAERSLRAASGASAAAEMLAWLGAKLVDTLRDDSGLPDRPGLAGARRRAGARESFSITEFTLCVDEASMLRTFETELSDHLMTDGSETGRAFRVLSLHAGNSPTRSVVAREVLAGRKAPAPAVGRRCRSVVPKDDAGPEEVPPRESRVVALQLSA